MKMTAAVPGLILIASVLSACATRAPESGSVPAHERAADARAQFFAGLRQLCGQRFEGQMSFPADPKHDFAGKQLAAQVASCTDTVVRVPFTVGEDRSRTWIFTRNAAGLELKHDHRHADGTPDEQTMYGGLAGLTGSALSQSFAADDYTGKLIEGAATNVWTVSLSPDGQRLTYHLERHARPRFTAVLHRVAR